MKCANYVGERLGASVVQDLSFACHGQGQSTELVSASGIETMEYS